MNKLFYLITISAFAFASPAFGMFTNGDFELGDFTGWNLDYGLVSSSGGATTWGYADNGLSAIIDNTAVMAGQTLDINPFTGNYMARINDIYGNYHATKIWQEDTITQLDIDNGGVLYVNWGAALVEPSNVHPIGDQPYFGIDITVNGITQDTFYADALTKQGGGWTLAGSNGGDLWYKTGQWSVDLSSFSIGDIVKAEMYVADCGWGGHGGYAFLDSIGTVQPPAPTDPSPVPVPGALLLGSLGTLLVNWTNKRNLV